MAGKGDLVTTIHLDNQASLTTTEMVILTKHVQDYTNLVTSAWGIEQRLVTTVPTVGAWSVFITYKNRHTNASGYHDALNNVPVIYCLPNTAYNRFGKYRKPWILRGKTILKESFRPGLLTVICHEVAEALIDANNDRYSAPDTSGHEWRVEIGDHCFGAYFTDANNYVYPDFTLPSFYDTKGVAPFTHLKSVGKPFTLTPKGYGYWIDRTTNKLVKI